MNKVLSLILSGSEMSLANATLSKECIQSQLIYDDG